MHQSVPELAVDDRIPRNRQMCSLSTGLLCCALLAGAAMAVGSDGWLPSHGLSALTLAIVFGIVVGNSVPARRSTQWAPGVAFAKQHLLRAGIVLYGLRLTFQDLAQVGWAGIAIDALVLSSTFALAVVVGTRIFKLDRSTAMLIGAGSAICGAAAVMATAPLLRARASQVTAAMATVVVFGTGAVFLYPLLYRLDLHWHLLGAGDNAFGIYAGSTIHEVAQVVAAGRAIGSAGAGTAVIAKMVRVMMLAPFLILLGAFEARARPNAPTGQRQVKAPLALPWFALAFIGVIGLHSVVRLPPPLLSGALQLDTLLLAIAMAALGLGTDRASVRGAGLKPLLLGALLFFWLIGGGALINRLLPALLS